MTTAVANVTQAQARFTTRNVERVWVVAEGMTGMHAAEIPRTLDTWNGYPVVRIEDLTPENHPFKSEDDDGDYFRA